MFCCPERNRCGHYEDDGCPHYECEWSSFDAIAQERFVDGVHVSIPGERYDGLPNADGQAVVSDTNLAYLATMDPEEALLMAAWSRMLLLDEGSWGNALVDRWCAECQGNWRACRHCRGQNAAVTAFLDQDGDRIILTEGMIHYWGNDIAGELRLFRGWCPHLPFDKRRATEEREWRPPPHVGGPAPAPQP